MEFVLVKHYFDLFEAELAKAKLESEDIPCFLQDEMTAMMTWMVKDAIGGIKLMVEEDYAERALAVINEFEIKDESLDFESSPE